jgi:integrase
MSLEHSPARQGSRYASTIAEFCDDHRISRSMLLGHADTRMVERVYGKLAQGHVKEVIEAAAPQLGFKPDRKVTALGRRP